MKAHVMSACVTTAGDAVQGLREQLRRRVRALMHLRHLRGLHSSRRLLLRKQQAEGGRRMRFLVTLALDAPDDADPQGIKEKVAMDFEKYGGVRVVKVERVEEYQQMTMEVQNGN